MAELILERSGQLLRYPFAAEHGASLKLLLEGDGLLLPNDCGGVGKCGLCRVQVVAGDCSPVGADEMALLGAERLAAGERLACRARPLGDVRLQLVTAQLPAMEVVRLGKAGAEAPLGVAVDLGTTRIRLALLDMAAAQLLATATLSNPQGRYGADVLGRLAAAAGGNGEALALLARAAIGSGLHALLAAADASAAGVRRLLVVGNSAMLALLANAGQRELLAQAGQMPQPQWHAPDAGQWRAQWQLPPTAPVELLPPLAGFIGSDLLAALLASRICEKSAPGLLIDFGTNTELALWDGARLWCASVPGGPAFEGSGLSCGMPRSKGAIERIECDGETLRLQVVGGGAPLGLCGSGLVDAIACLRRLGLLNRVGRLAAPHAGSYPLDAAGVLRLTHRDIDLFQRAKAATATATQLLLAEAGLTAADLSELAVTGAFGNGLDVAAAMAVGMLPELPVARFRLLPEGALSGCTELLFDPEKSARLNELRRMAQPLELSQQPDFDLQFVAGLYLDPIRGKAD